MSPQTKLIIFCTSHPLKQLSLLYFTECLLHPYSNCGATPTPLASSPNLPGTKYWGLAHGLLEPLSYSPFYLAIFLPLLLNLSCLPTAMPPWILAYVENSRMKKTVAWWKHKRHLFFPHEYFRELDSLWKLKIRVPTYSCINCIMHQNISTLCLVHHLTTQNNLRGLMEYFT